MQAAPGRAQAEYPIASQAEFGSDYIVEILRALGIEYAAFNPGASFRGLHDSIVNFAGRTDPKVVTCTHEEIAVAIAHGYAKASGKPMVAAIHDVVGLQHASMAIFNAWVDRVPVLLLGGTGPMDSTHRRPWIDWIHTALVQGNLVRDFVKYDDQPGSVEAVAESVLRAYRLMMTEPQGPVYVNFDVDVQETRVGRGLEVPNVRDFVETTRPQADPRALEQAASWLAAAEHPVLYAARLGRHPESVAALVELAELLAAPVLATDDRLSFPTTHPLNLSGDDQQQLQQADLILALDAWDLRGPLSTVDRVRRTAVSITRPHARVIQVSLKDLAVRSLVSDYQSLYPTQLSILADTSLAVPALVKLVKEQLRDENAPARQARREELAARHLGMRAAWKTNAEAQNAERPVSVAYLTAEVGRLVAGEDWVLAGNSFNPWPLRLWEFREPYQFASGSGGAGVGYGIGGAIGVSLAHRGTGRIMVNLQSDGDLLYNPGALWTIAQQQLPLLTVMLNNRSYYNSEEHSMRIAEFRGRPMDNAGIGTRLVEPEADFARLAGGLGMYAEGPIEDPSQLRPALERALETVRGGRPALVDVVTSAR